VATASTTVLKPEEYTNLPLDEPGAPAVGRWRSLVDFTQYPRDGSALEKGGAFFLPMESAHFEADPPVKNLLVRFRGFRGNTIGFLYRDGSGKTNESLRAVPFEGGSTSFLRPNASKRPSGYFDHQFFFLFHEGQRFFWEVQPSGTRIDGTAAEVGVEVAELNAQSRRLHHMPYDIPAVLRRCDALVPTADQLQEILSAKTSEELLAIPWAPFPADQELESFHGAFDRLCEWVVSGDMTAASAAAWEMLARHRMLAENPYRQVLQAVAESGAALLALQKAAATQSPWPELEGNSHYRLDQETRHAFVLVPVFLNREEAAAFAAKFGGHLATLAKKDPSPQKLIHDWLPGRIPFPIVPPTSGLKLHAYHLAAHRIYRSEKANWIWDTGELLPPENALWWEDEPGPTWGEESLAVLSWRSPKEKEGVPRVMGLGWESVKQDATDFPLIEFPATGTRYPYPEFNHLSARDALPGTTGDPLFDFENHFPHRWKEMVGQPVAALDRALREKYATALEQRARGIAQSGDLDAVLPWFYEIETIRGGQTPGELGADSPPQLRELRQVWIAESGKLAGQRKTFVDRAIAAADAELEEVQKQLVRENKIERAAEVEKRRAQLAAREGLPKEGKEP
jgi:hypothetical protein